MAVSAPEGPPEFAPPPGKSGGIPVAPCPGVVQRRRRRRERPNRARLGVVFLTVALGFSCKAGSPGPVTGPGTGVAAAIEAQFQQSASRNPRRRDDRLAALYAARQYRPIWSEEGTLLPAAENLVDAVAASAPRGLDPARYHVEDLERRVLTCGNLQSAQPEVRQRRLAECRVEGIVGGHRA